jgi:hypothetical protein
MAAKSISPLIGALFNSVTPPAEDKKRAKKSRGEKSVTEPMQQHGELANSKEPKMPTMSRQIKDSARHAKVRATQDWVEGRMSTEQHKRIHNRANHVLSNKKPHEFKGKSGERMPKKGSLGW